MRPVCIPARPSQLIHRLAKPIAALCVLMAVSFAYGQDRDRTPPMLADDEIEMIKVYEVDLSADPPPRIAIPRDKLRDFLKEFQQDDRIPRGKTNQEKWLRADGHVHLRLLFDLKARDYYKHVRVKSQNPALREWGNIHRRHILGYFQPTFGAGQVEGLYLFPRHRDSERVEMTNYYILTQATINGVPLIDRNQPEESLLVQWGLPRASAKFPAPEVEGWEPKYKDMKDERFIAHVDWIKSLFPGNQGSNLGVNYKLPGQKKPEN